MSESLNIRAQTLLKALIERYIKGGTPVGSKALADAVQLSPASIRNVLADLEDKGYIASPHTSAGRVPTALGYRFFVDCLVTCKPIGKKTLKEFQDKLSPNVDTKKLLSATSTYLSGLTHMAGLVTLPRCEHLSLSHIEFLPLSSNRILVILVMNEREVQNLIIHTERAFCRDELLHVSNYLNANFVGKDLSVIRDEIFKMMQADKERANQLMQTAIDMANKTFVQIKQEDYILAGQENLLDFAQQSNVHNLRDLFDTFTKKRDLVHLLDQCLQADGVQIFIGKESGYNALGEHSLVTSTYKADDKPIGVIGIIGPTRMQYDKIIPIVDVTAKILSAALNQ